MRHDGRKHSESTREPWGYRPHLDGLRSIAVYLVVLFHAGSAKFIGGFVGVDLFFVLSGFLVTNVILSDLAEYGSIRISRFYARRARRLIPAAAAAVIGTSLGALLIANPLDRAAFGDDARAASPWFANWHFIREANDYFNVDDAPSPFLHFWSLAIEEQFYLMFPVLLMVVWVLSRRRLGVMLGAFASLLVAMIVVQVAWASRDANRAYLGTDARAYQLLAGVVLALLLWKFAIPDVTRVPGRWVFPLAVVGLVVIASWMTDLSASRRGLLAAACSVVIIASAEAAGGGWLARVLGWRPIRYLGGISYGTYLWHWPVLVLVQRVVDVTPFAAFVLSASLGTALAALSFELIEQPVRRARQLDARPRMAIAAGVVLAAVTGLVIAPTMLNNDRPPAVFGTTEEPLYRSLDDASDQVVSIDLDASICPGLVLCPPIIDGVVVRRDNNHLSVAFAEWLADSVDAQLVEAGVLPAVQR